MNKLAFLPLIAGLTIGSASADMLKPSRSDQIKLGERAAADIKKKEKVLPATSERTVLLNRIAKRLLDTVADQKDPWHYSFDVVDDKTINAFALPGGPVFFYNGILDKLTTEDQVAGVLAHELTHVRKEHWAYAYARSQERTLGLSIVLILLRANKTVFDIASVSNDLLWTLPYSRKHETEADMLGYDMMVKAGYNPEGMQQVFEMLQKESKGGKPPEILSTHPDDGKRIGRIKGRIDEDIKKGTRFPLAVKLPWAPSTAPTERIPPSGRPSGGGGK